MTLDCRFHSWRPSLDPSERGIWQCEFCYRSTTQPIVVDMTEAAARVS